MHHDVLRVGVLCPFLRCLLKEIILVLQRSRLPNRQAALFLHGRDHLVLGLNLLDFFTEFCNNYLRFGLPRLLQQLLIVLLRILTLSIIDLQFFLIGLVMLRLLLHHFLSLFTVLLLLVF